MSWWETMDEHMVIRETVGYDVIKDVELHDLPNVLQFLKICWNYTKMKNIGEKKSE